MCCQDVNEYVTRPSENEDKFKTILLCLEIHFTDHHLLESLLEQTV